MDESKDTLNRTEKKEFMLVNGPITQNWTIEQIGKERPPLGWLNFFARKDVISELIALDRKMDKLGMYFPMKRDIFNAFNLCSLQDVKVIIIGQDPYHTSMSKIGVRYPIANGLAFSVNPFVNIPSSLRNIFKELITDLGVPEPTSGDLRLWAARGVFLINTCLTVDPLRKAGSHGKIWRGFVLKAIKEILQVNPSVPFILWGRVAQGIKADLNIDIKTFESYHPSGLSASRGFFGSRPFSKVNTYLESIGVEPIDWSLP